MNSPTDETTTVISLPDRFDDPSFIRAGSAVPDDSCVQKCGRKRLRSTLRWKKNVRKLNRNSGTEYITQKGRKIAAKIFISDLDCGCSKKCGEQISEYDRELFFTSFWRLADYSKQNSFLRGLIKSNRTKVTRTRDGTRGHKNNTFEYSMLAQGKNVKVCKTFFLKTLQISWGRVYRCLVKQEVFAVVDGRGRNPKNNKIDDSVVISHIKSFPTWQSHYTRKDNPERKYLNPELNIRIMYDMYVEKCIAEKITPVKQKFYYNVFSAKFNLHFKPPNKDTCRICDELTMKIKFCDESSALVAQQELHLRKAQQARDSLKNEVVSNEHYVCTFDLQKALPFPKLSTSVAYYKRNMYIYNFGIHVINTKIAFMYMWDETEGGRGSQEIAACIIKHLKANVPPDCKHITMYSDACGGQNRNIKLSLSLLKFIGSTATNADIIDIKFMASGHSFLPNDADFGVIENRSKKHQFIYSPDEWMEIVKKSKIKPPTYTVIQMQRSEFLSTKILEENITNRKKSVDGHQFSWLNIKWLRFERKSPLSIKFKETLSGEVEFCEINLRKGKAGKSVKSLQMLGQIELYPMRRPVTIEKKGHDGFAQVHTPSLP